MCDMNLTVQCPPRQTVCTFDCKFVMCSDPAEIRFSPEPRPDLFKFGGRISAAPHPLNDPSTTTVSILLENANGTVYSVDLAAGDMIATGPSSFIFENPSARLSGGVGLLKIRRSLQGPSLIVFKCYGDLSAATLSHMKATLTIGDQEFRSEGDWRQTPTGWFGAHFERQAP